MKRGICFLIILINVSFLHVQGQQKMSNRDSIIYTKLMKMDFKKYINKSGAIFFKDLGYTYNKASPITKKPGFIHRVLFDFSDSLYLEIAVKDLKQKERLNFNYKFKPNVFLSKKLNFVCLKYAGECIKGCEELDCN
jgi:hypothetical protein